MNSSSAIVLSLLVRRLRAELKLKLILTILLTLWVGVPYFLLQGHHFFPAIEMPSSFWDRQIPFSDEGVWIYFSLYLLMPVGPFLMTERRDIARYASGIVMISFIADLVFIFWPTWCPRPDINGTTAAYRMLIAMDHPFHAFPSLHAAFAVFSALCAGRVLHELRSPMLWKGVVWLWAFLILATTLTTKQHMLADIIGGSILGLGAYSCVFGQRGKQTSNL